MSDFRVTLKPGKDKPVRFGHPWVFSGAIGRVEGQPPNGTVVDVVNAQGEFLARGLYNRRSQLAVRLFTWDEGEAFDRDFLRRRLARAALWRNRAVAADTTAYRLVFSEADGLPGLVVDRYGDVLVGQTTTAGMERLKDAITEAVVKVLKPRALVWKNDAGSRAQENLPEYADLGYGALEAPVTVREHGLEFTIDPIGGQKTGWFYDQRANRDHLAALVPGKRVLDLFAYLGGWGLRAAQAGASEVLCVDASASAVERIGDNAARNGLAATVRAVKADAFDLLRQLREERERFDVVVCDPPAFIKRRKDLKEGQLAYRRINELAMQVLARDGMLISCSCSHHLPRTSLLEAIQHGARHLDRSVQALVQLQQGPDHPVHPAIPETDYLKGYLCRVLPA